MNLRQDFARHVRAIRPGRGAGLRVLLVGGFTALVAYRLGRWLLQLRVRPVAWAFAAAFLGPLYWLLARAVRGLYDIVLDPSAEIGPGLKIVHFGGISLRQCHLGAACLIHHQVRIEPASGREPGPTIGNRVWIGPHGRIVGPVRVGDGATIGAGAVVTTDVPERSVVVGNPARVVKMGYDNSLLRGGLA